MTIPSNSLYNGSINWNRIYRKSYSLERISNTVLDYLPQNNTTPIIFSGFSEVAAILSSHYPVNFIEFSDYMARQARLEYPEIETVVHADILHYLASSKAAVVCIVCRISANWNHYSYIEKLIHAISNKKRQLVLIDFFDESNFSNQTKIEIGKHSSTLEWRIYKQTINKNRIHIINSYIQSTYHLDSSELKYKENLASFNQKQLLNYLKNQLQDYNVSPRPSLIDNDPSFLLHITPKTTSGFTPICRTPS